MFGFVEAKRKKVTFLQVKIFEVSAKLFFAAFVVCIASPNFKFNDVLLAEIVYDYIHSFMVACLFFNVVTAYSIDDRSQISEEKFCG